MTLRIPPMLVALFALLALSATLPAQQPSASTRQPAPPGWNDASQPTPSRDGTYTLRAGTHLVALDVVVTDKKGHTVPGLTMQDFHLFEDDQQQNIKFFEEHEPVDPAVVARNKAALAASLPPNTFTSAEPFTGRAATVLLLNELTPLPSYDPGPLRQQMHNVINNAPPDTPFIVYQLDSRLSLIQPLTTDRDLALQAVDRMWVNQHFPPNIRATPEQVLVRRKTLTATMQQLSTALESMPGRKTLFAFTGGLRCSLAHTLMCNVDINSATFPDELKNYLCGVMDILEQGRISTYGYYPSDGDIVYGWGCNGSGTSLRDIFDSNSHYYTLYYTPTNEDWNGRYRKFKVAVARQELKPSYRAGYYGRAENATARRDASITPPPEVLTSASPTLTASVIKDAAPGPASGSVTSPVPAPTQNPASVVFTVQVTPAASLGTGPQAKPPSPGNRESEKLRLEGYRDYTLRFTMPASEFKLVEDPGSGQSPGQSRYAAKMEIAAVSYIDGNPADESSVQVAVNFDNPADSRIAKYMIAANLTVQVPEHGNRLLHLTVLDLATNQFGRLDIPVSRIAMPGR